MLAQKVRIFASCLRLSYITSTARGCYLCALQNKPDPAVPCCAALSLSLFLSLGVDEMK